VGSPLDAVFAALADPTRRWLVSRLATGGPRSATELARELPMSRQAVVHHLQTLDGAGLVDGERAGREVRWRATTAPLGPAMAWLRGACRPGDQGKDGR
jgi:DNA-binding transcriptional ArsR family regulator